MVSMSSRQAMSSIETSILDLRREEDRLTTMLRSATDEAARLRARQTEAWRGLARLKLDELTRNAVVGELDSAERAALDALERRKAALAEIGTKRAAMAEALAAAQKSRDAEGEKLETALAAAEALTDKTKARLAGDKAWIAMRDAAAAAEATAAAAAEKAAQSEADLAAKRKPYDADPVFTYLWRRGYGTSAYRAGPFVRFFDQKLARLVGYDTARPNYYMLNEIPRRLREHAARLKAAAETAKSDLQAFERKALEDDGIAGLEAEATAIEANRKKLDDGLDARKADLAGIDRDQAALLDPATDPAMTAAIDGLVAALAREDLSALYQAALRTPSPEDEKIVATLRDIEPTLKRREAEAEEVRKTAVDLARKRAQLEESRDAFRQSGYDDPMGRFDNGAVIGGMIEGVIRGSMTAGRARDSFARGGFSIGRNHGGSSFGGGLHFPSRPASPSPAPRPSGGFRTGGRF